MRFLVTVGKAATSHNRASQIYKCNADVECSHSGVYRFSLLRTLLSRAIVAFVMPDIFFNSYVRLVNFNLDAESLCLVIGTSTPRKAPAAA